MSLLLIPDAITYGYDLMSFVNTFRYWVICCVSVELVDRHSLGAGVSHCRNIYLTYSVHERYCESQG